jgi:hypothetical protein
MLARIQWLWTTYCVLIVVFVFKETYFLFAADSEIALYYLILRAFDPSFYLAYSAHLLRLLLTLIHCVPLMLYVYRVRFLPAVFWQFLFIARCLFEIIGNTYEITGLLAYSHQHPELVWIGPVFLVLPYIPSYVVCYVYAFRQEQVFGQV